METHFTHDSFMYSVPAHKQFAKNDRVKIKGVTNPRGGGTGQIVDVQENEGIPRYRVVFDEPMGTMTNAWYGLEQLTFVAAEPGIVFHAVELPQLPNGFRWNLTSAAGGGRNIELLHDDIGLLTSIPQRAGETIDVVGLTRNRISAKLAEHSRNLEEANARLNQLHTRVECLSVLDRHFIRNLQTPIHIPPVTWPESFETEVNVPYTTHTSKGTYEEGDFANLDVFHAPTIPISDALEQMIEPGNGGPYYVGEGMLVPFTKLHQRPVDGAQPIEPLTVGTRIRVKEVHPHYDFNGHFGVIDTTLPEAPEYIIRLQNGNAIQLGRSFVAATNFVPGDLVTVALDVPITLNIGWPKGTTPVGILHSIDDRTEQWNIEFIDGSFGKNIPEENLTLGVRAHWCRPAGENDD